MAAIEFLVDSIDDQGLVLGRNGQTGIPAGTVFTGIQKIRDNDLHETTHSINLRLIEVHWYHRIIEVVPGGHTAGLRLSGEGINELREALSKRLDREYIKLTGSIHGT